MDIAEIRKKAKAAPAVARQDMPSAVVEPAPAAGGESLPAVVATVADLLAGDLPASGSTTAGNGRSALDRLFAGGDGLQLAGEEDYQTALAAQGIQEESELSQFLAFQLGSEEYALDINQISEIIKPRDYTNIPRVPDYILGLVSLRGVVVPIFDLRQRFLLGRVDMSSAARIIVCRNGETTAGLLVDKINQVVKFAADRVEPPPAVLAGIDRSLISGVGRYQGRMIILLNLASVLEIIVA